MNRPLFKDLYCSKFGVEPENYGQHVFRKCLYPHAHTVAWFLRIVAPGFFTADFDFIHDVGNLRSFRDFSGSVSEFVYHRGNKGFLRRVVRLRVKSSALRDTVAELMAAERRRQHSDDDTPTGGTQFPFPDTEQPSRREPRADGFVIG